MVLTGVNYRVVVAGSSGNYGYRVKLKIKIIENVVLIKSIWSKIIITIIFFIQH